jgi:hypothetical protein
MKACCSSIVWTGAVALLLAAGPVAGQEVAEMDKNAEAPLSDLQRVDVCVFAATPGGVLAAVAAAREGRSVVLIEPGRWLGGICGAGLGLAQDCPIPEAVGGLAKKAFPFGRNLGVQKGFRNWLEERKVPVIYEHRVSSVEKQGVGIVHVRFEKAPPDKWGCPPEKPEPGSGITVEAKMFIDASYEGDLMARAGVKYAVGREPAAQYNEEHAGVRPVTNFAPIDPYVKPGDPASGLLLHVEADHGKPLGEGDDYTQAYNFRNPLAQRGGVQITPPENYDPLEFELLGRYIEHLKSGTGRNGSVEGRVPDWRKPNYQRQMLFSIAPLGVTRFYQDGDYATRARIWRQHIDYVRGLHHFLSTDLRVPEQFRKKIAALGLSKTDYPETDGWPHQLYVRVARRMLGRYVLTEADVMNRTAVADSVGLALYGLDTYPVRRIVVKDAKTGRLGVATEGNMFVGGDKGTGTPYPIPYRAVTPKQTECTNLLVPVSLSASFIAYASLRMEATFMVLGESAGVAAAQAIDQEKPVQQIDVPRLQKRLLDLGQVLTWPGESRK